MIQTEEFLKWLFRALFGVSIAIIGYFLVATIDDLKKRPTVSEVRVIVTEELDVVEDDIIKDRERIIKLEQAVTGIMSINSKLENIDKKLDTACEDIAAIKAK